MLTPSFRSVARAARAVQLPASLDLLVRIFRRAEWQIFAALAALFALPSGLGFLFYPRVFELSKGYIQLAKLFKIPQPLGAFAVLAALLTLFAIHRGAGRWGLLAVMGYWALLFFASLASVGLSGGTVLFALLFLLALYGFLRSGGVGPARDP